jgi:hypothetical protein
VLSGSREDKERWCREGAENEKLFVSDFCVKHGLPIVLNPDKEHDEFAPDLLYNGGLADLKFQSSPFFKVSERGGAQFKPQHSVTFNVKDYRRYSKDYPSITVVYWVIWHHLTEMFGKRVDPMVGVWVTPFADIVTRVEAGEAPVHEYQNRRNDHRGNARDSYILDLRWFQRLV